MSSDYSNYSHSPDQQPNWTEIKVADEKRPGESEPSEQQPLRLEEDAAGQETRSLAQKFKAVFKRERAPTSTEQPGQFPHTGTHPPSGKVKSWQKLSCCFDDKSTQPPTEPGPALFKQFWNDTERRGLIKKHAEASMNAESYNFLNAVEGYRKLCDYKRASSQDVAKEYNRIVDEFFKKGTALVPYSQLPQKIDVNSKISKSELKKRLDIQEGEVIREFSQSFFNSDIYKR